MVKFDEILESYKNVKYQYISYNLSTFSQPSQNLKKFYKIFGRQFSVFSFMD